MNLKSLLVAVFTIGLSISTTLGQITDNPRIEEQSAEYVKIKRVELTDQYTIVYLQFNERGVNTDQSYPRNFPGDIVPPRNSQTQSSTIWLDPETRLYKPGDVNAKFKFIRAENIPTSKVRKVSPGERVDFVAYFERLTPGIEIFDFYEGRSQQGQQSWNFYGVHIRNPLKKDVTKTPKVLPKAIPDRPSTEPTESKKPEESVKVVPQVEEPEFAVIKGTVFDSKTKQPIAAQIAYKEQGDSLHISSSSGKYRIGINPKERYSLRVTSKGYYGASAEVAAADSIGKISFTRDIFLTPLSVGETIALSNIYFETSQFALLPESFQELNELVQMMKDNAEIKIRVEGHTDNIGDRDKNIELSRKRAEAVREYLVKNGIREERIEAKGFGATKLITKSGSDEERRKNRRVEFVITSK